MLHRTWPRRRAVAVLGLGLGLCLLAGCGDGPADGSAPATAAPTASSDGDHAGEHADEWDIKQMPDPCRTVTRREVSTIVGRAASAGRRLESWPPLCQFVLQPRATLVYVADNSQPGGAVEFDQLRSGSEPVEPVTGLGDQAYWLSRSTALHVLTGRTHVKVIFAGPGVPPPARAKADARALAELALRRLTAGS